MATYLTTEAGKIDYSAVTKGRKVRTGKAHMRTIQVHWLICFPWWIGSERRTLYEQRLSMVLPQLLVAAVILFTVTVGAPMLFSSTWHSPGLMILLVANIALVYFVQKQRLATLKMSAELLLHFNGRYAELQPKLYRILEGEVADELAPGRWTIFSPIWIFAQKSITSSARI